jgi:hypothetical protein
MDSTLESAFLEKDSREFLFVAESALTQFLNSCILRFNVIEKITLKLGSLNSN